MRRLRRSRSREDKIARAEMLESIEEGRNVRAQLQSQRPEILEILRITQPPLMTDGFTEAIVDLLNPHPTAGGEDESA